MERSSHSGHPAGSHALETLRILLVDDDENLRFMLKLLLDDPKVDVIHEAGSGEEALIVADHESPHVVVVDCSMPGMSGDEAGRQLRTLLPSALIVSYSGLDADKPWADTAITKASGDDIERLKDTVLSARPGMHAA